jgi:hypothetical protein
MRTSVCRRGARRVSLALAGLARPAPRLAVACVILTAVSAAAQSPPADPVARLGEYVQNYYSKARSVVAEETVVVQPLQSDMTAAGFARRAVYELRVEWNPDAPTPAERATAVRTLLKEAGPPIYDKGEERCADPPLITPEPLSFLLPDNRAEWKFEIKRPDRIDGRPAITVEYSLREPHPARVTEKECLFTDLTGQTVGRLWADPATAEVLRVDERLTGLVEIKVPKEWWQRGRPREITFERLNSSVRYRRVAFTDPAEEMLLPVAIETVHVHRSDTAVSRLRITHSYANYRRFVTGSRVLP